MKPFIVENGVNTCYIDSLLIALFYIPSKTISMLNNDLSNSHYIYLQEYIKHDFLGEVRANLSVLAEVGENIRNLSMHCGWHADLLDKTKDDYYSQRNVVDYFNFLLNLFRGPLIETVSEEVMKKDSYITLQIPNKTEPTNLNALLKHWSESNRIVIGKNESSYILALYLPRYVDKNVIRTPVDIPKKVKFKGSSILSHETEWKFYSAICYNVDNCRGGHYYTLISYNHKYYIFDDLKIPCLNEIDMKNKEITSKLKTESVLMFYISCE